MNTTGGQMLIGDCDHNECDQDNTIMETDEDMVVDDVVMDDEQVVERMDEDNMVDEDDMALLRAVNQL